jgi:multidrug efflux pump subunit AcrB
MKAARTKRFRRYAADILLAGHLVIAFMLGALGAVDEALIVLTALPVSLIVHAWAYRPLAKP